MQTLPIIWKRLVKDGETCGRCGDTYREIRRALDMVRGELLAQGVEPALETCEIDEATFKADPLESNRIWIAGRPMEAWLDARVGSSPCCAACGDSNCRTIEVLGRSFETIPAELIAEAIVRAISSESLADARLGSS